MQFKLNALTLLLKPFFLLKDATRSCPVYKATNELDNRTKTNAQHVLGSLVWSCS